MTTETRESNRIESADRQAIFETIDRLMLARNPDRDQVTSTGYLIVAMHETEDALKMGLITSVNEADYDAIERMGEADSLVEKAQILGLDVSLSAAAIHGAKQATYKVVDEAGDEAIQMKFAAQTVAQIAASTGASDADVLRGLTSDDAPSLKLVN